MGCPKCGTDNFLGLDILCPACTEDSTPQEEKAQFYVLVAGDFLEDAEATFDDQADAEEKAVMCSIDDSAWLVCDAEGEVLSIAYGRELYTK